jgi:hypothetical protein
VSGNWDGTKSSVSSYDDIYDTGGSATFTPSQGNNGGNVVGFYNAPSPTKASPDVALAPLGNYGGTTQTMIPLLGSPAICAGTTANATAASLTTDQRGFARTTTYTIGGTPTPCVDAGAVQTGYALTFVAEPSANAFTGQALPVAPVVRLTENGLVDAVPTSTIVLSGSPVTLSGTTSAALSAGTATFGQFFVPSATSSEILTATLPLNSTLNMTAVSAGIDVAAPQPPVLTIQFGAAQVPVGETASLAFTVSNPNPVAITGVSFADPLPAGLVVSTPNGLTGPCPSGVISATAGGGSISLAGATLAANANCAFTVNTTGTVAGTANNSATPTSNEAGTGSASSASLTVYTPAAASLTATAGTGQSGYVGVRLTTALLANLADQFGRQISGATVTFTAPASGAGAVFSNGTNSITAQTDSGGNVSVTATANSTAGGYTVTATVGSLAASFPLTNLPPPNFVVTTPQDVRGQPPDCTSGNGNTCSLRDALAAANTAGVGNVTFSPTTFAATNTAALNTIQLSSSLTISANIAIAGLTTGSGSTLANLIRVSGGGTNSNFNIFRLSLGVTAAIANLNIANGQVQGTINGAAINNAGTLTVSNCNFSANSAANDGGAIYNRGTLTVSNSTFSGNSAALAKSTGSGGGGAIWNAPAGRLTVSNSTFSANSSQFGGGILNDGTLVVSNSTFTANSAAQFGGGIASDGTLTVSNSTFFANFADQNGGGILSVPTDSGTFALSNSIVSGNWDGTTSSVSSYDDLCDASGSTTFTSDLGNRGGNIVGFYNAPSPTKAIADVSLAPLGNYGGPTQTMIPLPGSAAICAGLPANILSGVTTDQRGLPNRNTSYSGDSAGTPCVDAGAVQTAYSLSFVAQPSNIQAGTSITPAPSVQVFENGTAISLAGAPIGISAAAGTLSGTTTQATSTSGVATWSNLSIATGEIADTLAASAAAGPYPVTATSGTFNVISIVALGFGTHPATPTTAGGNAGSAITVNELNSSNAIVNTATDPITLTVTGPGNYSKIYTANAVGGVATFNLSGAALTKAGTYTYTASESTLSSTVTEVVNAGAAAGVTGTGNATSGQSAAIGAAYTSPFSVVVTDANNNPVPNVTVTYSVPGNGASAVLSSTTAQTDASGAASVTGTANGTAGSFSVQASVSGVTSPVLFTVNNQKTSSVTTISGSPQEPVVYGASKTTLTSTTSYVPGLPATGTPSGSVTFQDSGTTISQPVTMTAGQAVYASYFAAGNHSFVAQYAGDSNYNTSTSSALPYQVTQAPVTVTALTGQSIPVFSTGSTLTVTITGAHSGSGILAPGSGGTATVSYVFFNGSTQVGGAYSATVAPGAAGSTAVLTIPSALANHAGTYSVHVAFNGDSNYQASGPALGGGSGNTLNLSFTVQQAAPVLSLACAEVTYDGSAHACVGSAKGNGGTTVAGSWSYSPSTVTNAGSTPVTGTFTSTDGNYSSGGTASGTLKIDKAPQTISFAPTSAVTYGVPPMSLVATGGASGKPVILSILSGPGSLNGNLLTITGAGTVKVAADEAGNSNYDAATEVTQSIVVNQAASRVLLTSDSNPVLRKNAITLTATVTSSAGVPAGVVTFLDGTTPLGTGNLSAGGVAIFSTAGLATGSHSITAAYIGDTNFTASSSSALTEVVEDFNLTIAGGSTGTTSVTAQPGEKAVFTFLVSPEGSSTFPATVTLSATGLPPGATYSFSPATLSAGMGATTVTLTIQIPQAGADSVAKLSPSKAPPAPVSAISDKLAFRLAPLSLALLLLPFARRMRRAGKGMGRMMSGLLMLGMGLAAVAGLSGCGSTNGFFGQQKTYTVTVTGTSGALSTFTTVTLTVE